MIPLEKLLEPVSTENPCGDDPFYDGRLNQLESLIKIELDAEEKEVEPDWRKVHKEALVLLEKSKDIRAAVILCAALLKLEGLGGFLEGLALLRGLTEKYWDSVFPLLDPEDPEDPSRINLIHNLTAPAHTGTPFRFIRFLQQIPLCRPARLSNTYNLRDLLRAQETAGPAESGDPPAATQDQISAAFNDTPQEWLQQTLQTVGKVKESAQALESAVNERSQQGMTCNLEPLLKTLDDMQGEIRSHILEPASEGAAPGQTDPTSPSKTAAPAAQGGFRGGIQSRADVELAFKEIVAYFRRAEPSSSVRFLVERAQRLLSMDFMQSVNELVPDSANEFNKLFGLSPEDKGSGSSGS